MLEKTLESPLDSKEIQLVHPKGNQSLIFIGRTDVEAETPILWPPDVKNWLTGEDPCAGKDWRQEEKGMTEDEMVGWHHRRMEMSLSKLQELAMDRESWHAESVGSQRVGHHWATQLNWLELHHMTPSPLDASGAGGSLHLPAASLDWKLSCLLALLSPGCSAHLWLL